MLNRNDDIELTIESLGSEGQGIGRVDGFAVFVPFALPGERVIAHVIKPGKSFAVAKLTEILEASPSRRNPHCTAFGRCGGCALMQLDYAAQLEYKQKLVKDALERIGGFIWINVEPIIGMEEPYRYRNKASFPTGYCDSRPCFGFYAPRSHRLIALDDCPIQQEELVLCAKATLSWAELYGVSCYDEATQKGVLRHIVARTTKTGKTMAVIVTTGALPHRTELIELLREGVPDIVSVIHNINAENTNVIFGSKYETIWGEDRIRETICGISFEISAASFLQVNSEQTEKLYSLVEDAIDDGAENVVDVYCGTGTLSLIAARKARHVSGIEYVPQAVEDAKRNAANNGIKCVEFVCADAARELPKMILAGCTPDVIIVDPPRKGCDAAVLEAMGNADPKRIIYVSCDPATLARDLKTLTRSGYMPVRVQSVDMFPHTSKVETVAVLEKRTRPAAE